MNAHRHFWGTSHHVMLRHPVAGSIPREVPDVALAEEIPEVAVADSLRHPLALVRLFARNSIRCWYGRLLLCALVWAVVFAGVPRLELHAHADAFAGHQHVQFDPAEDLSFADVGDTNAGAADHEDGDAPAIPHAHDVSGFSYAATAVAPAVLVTLEPVRLTFPPSISHPATWRTIPPYRPPIA